MSPSRVCVEMNRSFLDRLVKAGLGSDPTTALNNALFFALFLEKFKNADGCLHVQNGAPGESKAIIAIQAYAPRTGGEPERSRG